MTPDADAGHVDLPPQPKYIVHSTGRNVTPERKALIHTLAETLKLPAFQIAERLKMDVRTVKAVLGMPRDYDAVMARNLLDANALAAASAWVKSIQVGASKGRHEPARDLLLHRRIIEPVITSSVSASVSVILTGGELPSELRLNPHPFALEIPTQSETPSE
jgi:hypothetical protein